MARPRRTRKRGSAAQSPLETYLREIARTPLLTAAEEKALALRVEKGDTEARERLITANLRLAVNIARKYTGNGLPLQDLIEEGNLGLLRAVEGFDPRRNTRFTTYASFWIKQSIRRALINTGKTIRIPSCMVDLLTKWRKTALAMAEEFGRQPTHDEIGKRMRLTKKTLATIKKAIRVCNAMASGFNTQTEDSTQPAFDTPLDQLLTDHATPPPDDELIAAENAARVLDMLELLDEREATVLRLRFGLNGQQPQTLMQIAKAMACTREWVRQIEASALTTLREALSDEDAHTA